MRAVEQSVVQPAPAPIVRAMVMLLTLPLVLASIRSHESMAAGHSGEEQLSTTLISARSNEARGPVFETWVAQRDRGIVKQSLDYSCGIAALATLLNAHFEIEASEASLLLLLEQNADDWQLASDWREQGVSLAILRMLAQHYKLNAIGVSVTAAGLMRLQKPAIAFIDYRGSPHFTVVKSPRGDSRIELADPSWGNRALTQWQFLPMFLNDGYGKLLLVDKRE